MPTREHIEALAAAMAARPLAYYRSGRMGDPPSVVAMQRRAQRLCAAISSDPAAQDAVLAALVEGGRMVEEPDVYCLCGHHVAEHASDGCRWQWSSVRCACTILRPHRVRLVEPEWREVPNA